MTVSNELKEKLEVFEKTGELKIALHLKRELQNHCREVFRYSINISCPDCLGKYATKFSRYLKEQE